MVLRNLSTVLDYAINVAWTFPSWEGRFVIFAFPSSVSMIAPLIRMFCLARKVLDGVSSTFFIVDFFARHSAYPLVFGAPFTIIFAMLFRKETSFVVLPLPFKFFVWPEVPHRLCRLALFATPHSITGCATRIVRW